MPEEIGIGARLTGARAHTHTHTHAHTLARSHARTHARTHAHTCAHSRLSDHCFAVLHSFQRWPSEWVSADGVQACIWGHSQHPQLAQQGRQSGRGRRARAGWGRSREEGPQGDSCWPRRVSRQQSGHATGPTGPGSESICEQKSRWVSPHHVLLKPEGRRQWGNRCV